jgi:hypothetical protein
LQAAEKDAADASTKRPPDEGAASLNANEVLMLHSRLKIIQARAAQANKATLEAEKQRDELHTQIEQIEEQLSAKPSQCASRVSRQSTEASHRHGRFLARQGAHDDHFAHSSGSTLASHILHK